MSEPPERQPPGLRVLLLGSFEVWRDAQLVEHWDGRQARDLVKMLALVRGRAVSRDQIIDQIWDDPPPGAERHLKVLASRARRALGDIEHQLIVTTAAGYALGKHCWVDTEAFERLIKEATNWERAGRPALAEASYRAALALYRGQLLAEDQYADWASAERDRYHRLYLESTFSLAGLLFRRSDAEALALAECLLAEDPYSDIAVQAVLVSLAAFGNVAAATDAYERFRRRVLEDLDAQPSPETEAVYRSIFSGRPGGSWPRTRPKDHSKPLNLRSELPLAGRDRELEALESALDAAAGGHTGLVVLAGEAGIGKSRLLGSLRDLAFGHFLVLDAAGKERERHLPFQLLAEAIRSILAGSEPAVIASAAEQYGDVIAGLVPEMSPIVQPGGSAWTGPILRRRVMEGVLSFVRSLADRKPLLIVLDDVHWSDPSTIDALHFCLSRLRSRRLLCAIAVRPGEPGTEAIESLVGLPNAQILELAPLHPHEVLQILSGMSPKRAERIVRESAGIPFYVVELARSAEQSGDDVGLVTGIREAILRRTSRLPVSVRRSLEAAAVLGDPFVAQDVAGLTGLSLDTVFSGLDELTRRHLVADAGPGASWHRFQHDLVRRVTYEHISSARRRALHGRVTDLALGDAAVRGRHALLAGRAGEASNLLRLAGDAALARLATFEAEELFLQSLRAAEEGQLGRSEQTDLLDRIGRARTARGDYAVAAEAHHAALRLAGDEVAAGYQKVRLGWIAYYQHDSSRAEDLANDAESVGDSDLRAYALLLRAKVAHVTGRVADASEQLAEVFRNAGPDVDAEARALEVALANHRGRLWEAVLHFQSASTTLRRDGMLRSLASGMLHAGIALAGHGDYIRAISILEESYELCRQAGAESLMARVPNTLASIYRQLGQLNRAHELDVESLALAERTSMDEAKGHTLVNLAESALRAGDIVAVRAHLDSAEPIVLDPLVLYSWRVRLRWRLVAGQVALVEDRPDDALAAAETILAEAKRTSSPKYELLAHLVRAQVLGRQHGGAADARSAFDLARRMNARPLIVQAARVLAQVVPETDAGKYRILGQEIIDSLAAPFPDDLRKTFVSTWEKRE